MPIKKTGKKGAIRLGPEGVVVENIPFSKDKAEIERYVARQFVDHPPREETAYFKSKTLRQNAEDDLDFTVDTAEGKKYLELKEFAPLEKFGGDHANVPSMHNVGEMAKWYCQLVEEGSTRYAGIPNIFLITYSTERTLNLMACYRLVRSMLNREQLSLERVYYVSLHGRTGSSSLRLYPVAEAILSQEEERRWGAMTATVPRIEDMRFHENHVDIPVQTGRTIGRDES